jgi:peptidyl-prolyl cis-trans isomerase D
MLYLMRKHAQSWLIKLALGAIVVVFVFWGVGSYRAQRGNRVAVVNGAPIVVEEFRGAYHQLLEVYRRQFGNAIDEKLIQGLNLKREALDQLINRRLLLQEAARLNFRITNEELFRAIEQVPAFQKNGRFQSQVYRRVLMHNRMTPDLYEKNKKTELLIEKLQGLILGSIKVSEAEALETYKWLEEKVSLNFVFFQASAYGNIEVTTEEIEAYFLGHKKAYETTPKVKVRYLLLDFKVFEARAKVSEDAAKTLAFDRAEEVYEACYGAGNISDAAKMNRLEVHETGFFPRNGPVNGIKDGKKFAKTAFLLEENEVSEPVELSDGYYILELVARKPAKIPDLKSVQERVTQDLIQARKNDLAKKDAEEFLNDLKGGAEFQKAAASRKLEAKSTGFFNRFGAIPEIGLERVVQETAFSLSESRPFPEAVIKGKQGYYVPQFKARQEADPSEFEKRKAEITSSLLLRKRQQAIKELLARLRQKSEITIKDGFLD